MPSDLTRSLDSVRVHHDQLLAVDACPDPLINQRVRDRVERTAHRDRRLPAHLPGLPEAHGVRHSGEPVKPLVLSRQADQRRLLRRAMHSRVDVRHPLLARGLQLRERSVGRPEVVICREQIGLRDLHRRLAAAFRLRVGRHTRLDAHPVMPSHRHDLRVAHSDPAHVIHRHRLLVVSQQIGRRAVEHPQRPVDRHHHRRDRLIAQRHHDPEPRPRQPRAEQHRLAPIDDRPIAIIELRPQPRLRRPRSRDPSMLTPPPTLGLSDPPPRRPRRPEVPERDQLAVRDIPPNLPVRARDELVDLPLILELHRRALALELRHQPKVPLRHPVRDRLVITTRQLCRAAQRSGQIVCLQDLHHFLRFLHTRPPRLGSKIEPRSVANRQIQENRGEKRRPPTGRNPGRQWGVSVAARGEVLTAAVTRGARQARTRLSPLRHSLRSRLRDDSRVCRLVSGGVTTLPSTTHCCDDRLS